MVIKNSELIELEIIPKDWTFKKIKNIANVIRGASPRPKGDNRFYGGNIPRLMVKDVTRDGKFVIPKVDFLTTEGAKRSRPCKKGTLTIVCSGTVGIPSFLDVDACIHDGFLAITNLKKNISSDYLYYQLSSLRNKFETSATHGGVFTNLTTSILEEFQVAFPPTKDEQLEIALSLSNVDDLIKKFGLLIQKKKNIKQGTMQELLTGKRRLEGFCGEWIEREFGSLTILLTNGFVGKAKDHYVNYVDGVLYVQGYNVKENDFNFHGIKRISHSFNENHKKSQLRLGDLLTIQTGDIGVTAIVTPELVGANCHALIISRLKQNEADPRFYSQYFNSKNGKNKLKEIETGTTMKHLNVGDMTKLMIPYPKPKEQTAISEILQQMDFEIKELEKQLEKYTNLKQAMMQKLLTGEIRLV
ncbi:restriction endonuclease subunit S [Candidatus Nitrosopelagicus sp.]|nr:restriction endonuclease subunit S [Candidatus Nitrosopelagicus sp.]